MTVRPVLLLGFNLRASVYPCLAQGQESWEPVRRALRASRAIRMCYCHRLPSNIVLYSIPSGKLRPVSTLLAFCIRACTLGLCPEDGLTSGLTSVPGPDFFT